MTKTNKCDADICFGATGTRCPRVRCEFCLMSAHTKCVDIANSLMKPLRDSPGVCWLCQKCRNPDNRNSKSSPNHINELILQRTTSSLTLIAALVDSMKLFCNMYSQSCSRPSCSTTNRNNPANDLNPSPGDAFHNPLNFTEMFESILGDKRPRTSSLSRSSLSHPDKIAKVDFPVPPLSAAPTIASPVSETTFSEVLVAPIAMDCEPAVANVLGRTSVDTVQQDATELAVVNSSQQAAAQQAAAQLAAAQQAAAQQAAAQQAAAQQAAAQLAAAQQASAQQAAVHAAQQVNADAAQQAAAYAAVDSSQRAAFHAAQQAAAHAAQQAYADAAQQAVTYATVDSIQRAAVHAAQQAAAQQAAAQQAAAQQAAALQAAAQQAVVQQANADAVQQAAAHATVDSEQHAAVYAAQQAAGQHVTADAAQQAFVHATAQQAATQQVTAQQTAVQQAAAHAARQDAALSVERVAAHVAIRAAARAAERAAERAAVQAVVQSGERTSPHTTSITELAVAAATTHSMTRPVLAVAPSEPQKWFYVTRFLPHETEDNLIRYIHGKTKCDPSLILCHKLVRQDNGDGRPLTFLSFKICVPECIEEIINSTNFWPTGVTIKPFLGSRSRSTPARSRSIPQSRASRLNTPSKQVIIPPAKHLTATLPPALNNHQAFTSFPLTRTPVLPPFMPQYHQLPMFPHYQMAPPILGLNQQ